MSYEKPGRITMLFMALVKNGEAKTGLTEITIPNRFKNPVGNSICIL